MTHIFSVILIPKYNFIQALSKTLDVFDHSALKDTHATNKDTLLFFCE